MDDPNDNLAEQVAREIMGCEWVTREYVGKTRVPRPYMRRFLEASPHIDSADWIVVKDDPDGIPMQHVPPPLDNDRAADVIQQMLNWEPEYHFYCRNLAGHYIANFERQEEPFLDFDASDKDFTVAVCRAALAAVRAERDKKA